MKHEKMKSQIEVYICNHKRDNGDDCFHKGGKDITDDVKKWAKENYPGTVKVYRSGCLGKCENGVAISCYPAKDFLLEANKDSIEEIKTYIKHQVG